MLAVDERLTRLGMRTQRQKSDMLSARGGCRMRGRGVFIVFTQMVFPPSGVQISQQHYSHLINMLEKKSGPLSFRTCSLLQHMRRTILDVPEVRK